MIKHNETPLAERYLNKILEGGRNLKLETKEEVKLLETALLIHTAMEKHHFVYLTPSVYAGGILYLASRLLKYDILQRQVMIAVGVSEVSVRNGFYYCRKNARKITDDIEIVRLMRNFRDDD